MTTEERFWAKVDKRGDCWLWTGARRNGGYGAFVYSRDGEVVQGRAHRFSYELHVGPIPAGMFVMHKCDVPRCVRPDHLTVGTCKDNVHDMIQKGRRVPGGTYSRSGYQRGGLHHGAKLSERTVRAIRSDRDSGLSFSAIAAKYGVAISTAWRIVARKAWSHVD
jgi:hypothetical protein